MPISSVKVLGVAERSPSDSSTKRKDGLSFDGSMDTPTSHLPEPMPSQVLPSALVTDRMTVCLVAKLRPESVGMFAVEIDPNDKVLRPARVDCASPKFNTQVVLVMVPDKTNEPWSGVWAWPMASAPSSTQAKADFQRVEIDKNCM